MQNNRNACRPASFAAKLALAGALSAAASGSWAADPAPVEPGEVPAVRAPALSEAADAGPMLKFCHADWPPFSFTDKAGLQDGISIQVMREAFKRAGRDVTLDILPWKRCVQDATSGALDGLVDTAASRQGLAILVNSWNFSANSFWVRHDARDKGFEGFAQFYGRPVGYPLGYAAVDRVKAHPAILLESAPADELNFRKLQTGRVDAILAGLLDGRNFASQYNPPPRPLSPAYELMDLYLGFNPRRAALANEIDPIIAAMLGDGTVDAFYRRQVGVTFSQLMKDVGRDPRATFGGKAPVGGS